MDKAGSYHLRNMLIRARQKRREKAEASRGNVIPLQAFREIAVPSQHRERDSAAKPPGDSLDIA
jgi:hypothetical protein